MNYQIIYDNLVKKNHVFQDGEYFESHHILPKSLGGKDINDNLVCLTAREHYIAHALLVKITEQNGDISVYNKMLYAFNCMRWGSVNGNRHFKFNSKLYQKLKEKYSLLRQELMVNGITNPSFGKSWIHNDELCQSKLWDMSIPLPNGWKVGRKIIWDSQKKPNHKRTIFKHKNKEPTNCVDKENILHQKIKILTNMYSDYVQYGLQYVRDKYNYKKSQENLGMQFKKYIPNYDGKKLRSIAFKVKTQTHGRYDSKTKNMSIDEKKKYFTKVYRFFKQNGYDETIRYFQYNGTRNALTYNFRTYVDEYVPNKCRRWNRKETN